MADATEHSLGRGHHVVTLHSDESKRPEYGVPHSPWCRWVESEGRSTNPNHALSCDCGALLPPEGT